MGQNAVHNIQKAKAESPIWRLSIAVRHSRAVVSGSSTSRLHARSGVCEISVSDSCVLCVSCGRAAR